MAMLLVNKKQSRGYNFALIKIKNLSALIGAHPCIGAEWAGLCPETVLTIRHTSTNHSGLQEVRTISYDPDYKIGGCQ